MRWAKNVFPQMPVRVFVLRIYTHHYQVNKLSSPTNAMEALGEGRYSSYSFTTSALDGVSGQRHSPAALYPVEMAIGTHYTGGWVGPRAGLDREGRGKIILPLPGIEPISPGRAVRTQTLY
jgi:hypothetical protein